MNKYFIEFEFETNFNNKYWLPLFIEADNIEKAEEVYKRIKAGIQEQYSITNASFPKLYSENYNSEFIHDYINNNFRGDIKTLELNNWRFKDAMLNNNISFEKNLKLFSIDDMEDLENITVAETVSRHNFPVKIIKSNQDFKDIDEFLLINLVSPKFINKLIGAFKNRRV